MDPAVRRKGANRIHVPEVMPEVVFSNLATAVNFKATRSSYEGRSALARLLATAHFEY